MNFLSSLTQALNSGRLPKKVYTIILGLYESYASSLQLCGMNMQEFDYVFDALLSRVLVQLEAPYSFEPYHKKILQPYDYYQFGINFIRPLVDRTRSHIKGKHNLDKMLSQIDKGENVILYANHQTEVDPQLMSLMLEDCYSKIGEEVIFVAGDRVLTDPIAAPFSMGRNLLCIYSKRHIDNPPDKKEEKMQHNQKTMNRMKELLQEGGKCIYVAPSGGRDRASATGEVLVSSFDPQSIEMFRLMSKQANRPTHFYPLALVTFNILPPPPSIEPELGEMRKASRDGALFYFGDEIEMDHFPGSEISDRHAKRAARAQYIWSLVNQNYLLLKQGDIS